MFNLLNSEHMVRVDKLLKSKEQREVWSLSSSSAVIDALRLMAEKGIGAVPVVDGERLVGIFSERDYASKGIIQGRKAKTTPVTEVMTHEVITVKLENSINECMQLMTHHKIRHLPVVENQKLIGILSIGDIVMATIHEQTHHINYLEHYIVGV
jgi:CBS domain-containing protein